MTSTEDAPVICSGKDEESQADIPIVDEAEVTSPVDLKALMNGDTPTLEELAKRVEDLEKKFEVKSEGEVKEPSPLCVVITVLILFMFIHYLF